MSKNLRSKFCEIPCLLCENKICSYVLMSKKLRNSWRKMKTNWQFIISLFCLFLKNLPSRMEHTFSKAGQKKFWTKTTFLLGEIIRHLKKIIRYIFFRMCRIILPIFRAQNRKKRVEITLYRTISTS